MERDFVNAIYFLYGRGVSAKAGLQKLDAASQYFFPLLLPASTLLSAKSITTNVLALKKVRGIRAYTAFSAQAFYYIIYLHRMNATVCVVVNSVGLTKCAAVPHVFYMSGSSVLPCAGCERSRAKIECVGTILHAYLNFVCRDSSAVYNWPIKATVAGDPAGAPVAAAAAADRPAVRMVYPINMKDMRAGDRWSDDHYYIPVLESAITMADIMQNIMLFMPWLSPGNILVCQDVQALTAVGEGKPGILKETYSPGIPWEPLGNAYYSLVVMSISTDALAAAAPSTGDDND